MLLDNGKGKATPKKKELHRKRAWDREYQKWFFGVPDMALNPGEISQGTTHVDEISGFISALLVKEFLPFYYQWDEGPVAVATSPARHSKS